MWGITILLLLIGSFISYKMEEEDKKNAKKNSAKKQSDKEGQANDADVAEAMIWLHLAHIVKPTACEVDKNKKRGR